ncbi:peptidoglycan-binding protein [Patescibacteria group bacterium]|nr:peptidoglycan-binding protein [Patescibacteria group bacterium]
MKRRFFIILTIAVFLGIGSTTEAASIGEKRSFYVDRSYDIIARQEITGVLQEVGRKAYFYIDENWWQTMSLTEQSNTRSALRGLSEEFDNNIYSKITETYGYEVRPGLDNDYRITVLVHPMKESAGGYFNSGNQYSRLENPISNEKEMIYLNSDYISTYLAKSFLAHELTHLITFNQKEVLRGVTEDVWLNEARADYAPTIIGYDDNYARSNLKERVSVFVKNPSDSLVEWQGLNKDYGALELFTQYLVEHYSVKILVDSLQYKGSGIDSLNYALKKNGYSQDFGQVFTDWTVAVLLNNCSLGKKYCFSNPNLEKMKITPVLNFLPINNKSTLGVSGTTKNWQGNWTKFIGGNGTIKIEFIGNPDNIFKIPYVVNKTDGGYYIDFMQLDERQRGEITVSEAESIIIIPSVQTKTMGFINPEVSVSYFWSASVVESPTDTKEVSSRYLEKPITNMSENELRAKIAEIQTLLNQLLSQLTGLIPVTPSNVPARTSCDNISQTMNIGSRGSSVSCLQEFLKNQGADVYPEGLVTGYFGNLTKQAVIRFQEKYTSEILTPIGLSIGSGYVGKMTLSKINLLLTSM